MRSRSVLRSLASPAALLFGWTNAFTIGQTPDKLREPLPLEVAVSLRAHNDRSPVHLSPDGQWVAHTVKSDENVPRATHQYSTTGFPLAEGDFRMEATLTNTMNGESIRLGGPNSSSWAAVWSPDGSKVAFYSDEGGEAGVWIWETGTRKSSRFPGVVARPYVGFEIVRWSSDGQRLLCKVLPAGMTLAQANALGTNLELPARFPKVGPGQPSVVVRRSDPKETKAVAAKPATEVKKKPEGNIGWAICDLAILDLTTQKVTRLVERTPVRWYAFSPDEKSVAYTVFKGWEPNSQQSNFDLGVADVAGRARRKLAEDVRFAYGIEWNWSPEGRRIAYIESGQLAKGQIVVLSVADGGPRRLAGRGLPSFDPGDGEYPPLWDAEGENLYAVGGGELWRVDASSGEGAAVGAIPGWEIRAVVTPFGRPTASSRDAGRTIWVLARETSGANSGLFAVDVAERKTRPALQEPKVYSAIFNLDLCEKTGEIAFVSTDQQHLHDVWVFDPRGGKTRRASHLNQSMDRYELGTGRIIEWRSMDGQPLRGALLLPPGYQNGRRVPLVVWVYGGRDGSKYVNRFGLWGDLPSFNFHILATRGYAVLFPNSPLRDGMPMTDLMRTVMPAVNAAIDQGYADPDRLAVMGQSYGSYCTLALITQTKRFKAAVITAAVLHPDLFADYLNHTGYYEKGQGNMRGTIWEQRERYFANSPLFLFDRIETPLLIGQGEKDGRLIASDAIFAGLERLGKNVEYRIYENEGHAITQRPNVLDFWNRRLDFLSEYLDVARDAKGGIVFERERARSRESAAPAAEKALR